MKFLPVLLAALAVSATPIAEADPENMDSEKRELEPRWQNLRTNTAVHCRESPDPNSRSHRKFPAGTVIRAQCGVDMSTGLWLKVDPGPRLAWCYTLAYYTNYFDPSVPNIVRC